MWLKQYLRKGCNYAQQAEVNDKNFLKYLQLQKKYQNYNYMMYETIFQLQDYKSSAFLTISY